MRTQNRVSIEASPATVYALAAAIEEWPRYLPHYRWVRILCEREGGERLVEMAARRGWIPVWWRSLQRLFPDQRRIGFLHVAGATRGMRVEWRIEPTSSGGCSVTVQHDFQPGWPLVPDAVVRRVVGEFFVASIASRTLRAIKERAESQERGRVRP